MGNFVYITQVIWIENIYYPRETNKVLLFAKYIIVFVNQSDKETGGYMNTTKAFLSLWVHSIHTHPWSEHSRMTVLVITAICDRKVSMRYVIENQSYASLWYHSGPYYNST